MKTWEYETDHEQYGNRVYRYLAGEPVQVGVENAKNRRYRVQLAKRLLACAKGERHVVKGYYVCCGVEGRPRTYLRDIVGSYKYFKTTRVDWQLARVVKVAEECTDQGTFTHDQAFAFSTTYIFLRTS